MRLFNTRTKKLEKFKPIDNSLIKMYVCGPTVYDKPHIGNARPAVVFDVLYRLLQKKYPKVLYGRNITDIDDKIINAANERGVTISDITSKALAEFEKDMSALNIQKPTFEPKATEYVEKMCEVIQKLLEKKLAYVGENGDVMFDVEQYPHYGCFKKINEIEETDESSSKKHPYDFVLWKHIPTEQLEAAIEHKYAWETPEFMSVKPNSYGRPGWHLECTAMSTSLLGEMFDIHGGGQDLIFPHHENERAQTCGYSGNKECCNYWLHNGLIQYQNGKMSKSLGNIVYLDDVCEKWSALSVRFFFLQTHYRNALNWTEKGLKLAHDRYTNLIKKIYQKYEENDETDNAIQEILEQDLNTSLSITKIEKYIVKGDIGKALAGLELLGLLYGNKKKDLLAWLQRRPLTKEQEKWMNERAQARAEKNYALSDQLRDKLHSTGVIVEDTKKGSWWYVI